MKKLFLTLLTAVLLLLPACGTGAAPTAAPTPTPTAEPFADVKEAVSELARAYLAEAAENCGFAVADTQLTGIVPLDTYDNILPDAAVTVYRLEFRLKPEKQDEVVLAGGRVLDDEGWLLQYESMGSPCLVVSESGEACTLLGKTWDGEIGLDGGWEGRLGSLLMQWGEEREDASMTLAGETAFARSLLAEADEAMAPLLGKASVEGEPYTDESGRVWHKLAGYEKQGDLRMDDQILSSLSLIFPQELANDLFDRYIYLPDSILLERESGLYVRDDAALVMDWDYTADRSSLTVDESQSSEGRLEFSVQGTGHGGALTWLFTALRDDDGMWYLYRYYTLAAEGWSVPPEFAILADGDWFGLGSGEAPKGLGEASHSSRSELNVYDQGGGWRTEYYEDVTATRYENSTDRIFGVVTMEVLRPGLPTWRGVQLGDSLEAVASAYPEATLQVSSYGPTGRYLDFQSNPNGPGGYSLDLYFDEKDTLVAMMFHDNFD